MSDYSCNEHGKEYVKGCVACDFPREFEELERENADLKRQLAEAQRVPPDAFGDSRYAVGWNDCLAWIRQVRSDAAIAAAQSGGKDE